MNLRIRLRGGLAKAWTFRRFNVPPFRHFAVLLLALAATSGAGAGLPSVPAARQAATDIYHGVAVVDDYQWLEDGPAPAVREWTRLENERTREYFGRLPYRRGIAQELRQLRSEESARYSGFPEEKGRIFGLRFKPPAQQPVLVWLSSLEPPALWRTVFDPNIYNTNGTTAMDWYAPSPDGRRVAVSLSEGGSEQGTRHFFETDTGKALGDEVPRVQFPTAGGSAAWAADSSGVFDDFIAAAEHLVQRRYTNPSKLAVEGGSNGGLLMGAFLTQRPDLARAVVSHVGIYDMLRVELDANGQFNVTEFGAVKDPEQFRALCAYSPYHHVRDGVKYPAVLLTTGENDGRVNPAQSRKMAARLQAATASGRPILFRSTASAGHGIGTSLNERIAEQTDVYAFLFDQLGIDASRWTF
jgi:prolyl oligopeptidase PreP (S9A serine peptidase family)